MSDREFMRNHDAGLEVLGRGTGVPDSLCRLADCILEIVTGEQDDKLTAALGAILIRHRETSHIASREPMHIEVSAVRGFTHADGIGTVNDYPDTAEAFAVYICNPLALHVQDFPIWAGSDRAAAHVAAHRWAHELASALGCAVVSKVAPIEAPAATRDPFVAIQAAAKRAGETIRQAAINMQAMRAPAAADLGRETAAILWEAILALDPHAEPDGKDAFADAVRAAKECIGTASLRGIVIGWADAVDEDWQAVEDDWDSYAFDWDYAPAWLLANADFSVAGYPFILPQRVQPVRPDGMPTPAPTEAPAADPFAGLPVVPLDHPDADGAGDGRDMQHTTGNYLTAHNQEIVRNALILWSETDAGSDPEDEAWARDFAEEIAGGTYILVTGTAPEIVAPATMSGCIFWIALALSADGDLHWSDNIWGDGLSAADALHEAARMSSDFEGVPAGCIIEVHGPFTANAAMTSPPL